MVTRTAEPNSQDAAMGADRYGVRRSPVRQGRRRQSWPSCGASSERSVRQRQQYPTSARHTRTRCRIAEAGRRSGMRRSAQATSPRGRCRYGRHIVSIAWPTGVPAHRTPAVSSSRWSRDPAALPIFPNCFKFAAAGLPTTKGALSSAGVADEQLNTTRHHSQPLPHLRL